MVWQRIGDILKERGLISDKDIEQALKLQKETDSLIGQALIRLGAVSEENLLDALSYQLDIPVLDPAHMPDTPEFYEQAIELLGLDKDWLYLNRCAIWVDPKGPSNSVKVIAQDILDNQLREKLENASYKKNIELIDYLTHNHTLESAIDQIRPKQRIVQDGNDTQYLRELAEGAPIIDFVNRVFATALKQNASDIHIEPFEYKFQVRYRIDGVLHTHQSEPRSQFDAVVSRVKLLSGMDIAERRLPQDGRQTIRFSGQEIDLRVSSLPGSWGESLVLRLLSKDNELPSLESLGLQGRAHIYLQKLLSYPNGVILVTGPTGSGKSTTLYRSLLGLNDGIRKIITIEDPVEYDMDGIIQIQTKSNIGYTFALGLKAILRQDPDVIMVGEIRDGETASIAAQAALTGHLVLSTLHTNSALAAIARLIDIGLEPYMVASAVRGLVAQRLVRRLCPRCSQAVKSSEGEKLIWEMVKSGLVLGDQMKKKAQWRSPKGCNYCSNTGYIGRVAIFEIVEIDDALSDAIQQQFSLQKLLHVAKQQGFITLMADGILKAREGVTSLAEVQRVCGMDLTLIDSGESNK